MRVARKFKNFCWWSAGLLMLASVVLVTGAVIGVAWQEFDGRKINAPFLEWLCTFGALVAMTLSTLVGCIAFAIEAVLDLR